MGGLLVLGACGGDNTFVPWRDATEGEAVFFVTTENAVVLSVDGPFESASPGDAPSRFLLRDKVQLHRITVELSALARRVPSFVITELSLAWFESRSLACEGIERRLGARIVPLEADFAHTELLEGEVFVEIDPASVPLSLGLPVDEDACVGSPPTRFQAFGPSPRLDLLIREPDVRSYPVRRAAEIGTSRIAVINDIALMILDRGLPPEDSPSRVWGPDSMPPPEETNNPWRLGAVAVDRHRSTPDRARLLLIMASGDGVQEVLFNQLVELEWTPAGFSQPTLISRSRTRLNALESLDDGRVVVLGDDGTLLVRSTSTTTFTVLRQIGLDRISLQSIVSGPSVREPFALLDGGHGFHFGTLLPGEVVRSELSAFSIGAANRLVAVRSGAGEVFLFSDTESPELIRRDPDASQSVFQVELPETLAVCAGPPDACGRRALAGGRPAIAATPNGTLLVVPTDCSLILELGVESGCVRAVEHEGEPWQDGRAGNRPSLSPGPSATVLFGPEGLLLESRFNPD